MKAMGLFVQSKMKSSEQLSQTDKINSPLYPHEIFAAG
jgi:hypothetical protein